MKRIFYFLFFNSLFLLLTSFVYASETTVYLGSIEKTIETGEVKIYIPAGSATVVRTNNKTEYLYADHLGSTSLVTDEQGNKTETNLYYPYGKNTSNQLFSYQYDKLYTGQRLDSSSDLYFYNARYYNPQIGNFISADKAQGPNRYSYVGNNPIMRNDPSGMVMSEGGGGGGGSNISLVQVGSSSSFGISASGVSNNTNNIALPGQSYCELNPGSCEADPAGFWSLMGVAGSLAILPLSAVAQPAYEILDTAICAATSDLGTCLMFAAAPGPTVRKSRVVEDYQRYIDQGANLIKIGDYEGAINHFRSAEAAQAAGLSFSHQAQSVFLTDTPSLNEVSAIADTVAMHSHFNIDQLNPSTGTIKPSNAIAYRFENGHVIGLPLPSELQQEIALVHMEEWCHGLQCLIGGNITSSAIHYETDIAAYMDQLGVPMTQTFLQRYDRYLHIPQ